MTKYHATCLVVFIVMGCLPSLLGVGIGRRWSGILVDQRNKYSLSRLQLIIWTWLLTSTFLAVAISTDTMDINMPSSILAPMGISVGSAAGSVIVKGNKAGQQPAPAVAARLFAPADQQVIPGLLAPGAQLLAPPAAVAPPLGILATNANCKDASLSDLFSGEELTNCQYVDIGKVQMFFFTAATVIGYARILWLFNPSGSSVTFPDLSASLVTLLGISHAGYISIKAAPKTPTA